MFTYKKSITGKGDIKKIWDMYSNVDNWRLWDGGVKSVQLSGNFCVGTNGLMEMVDGSTLPFTIIECIKERSFTTESKLDSIVVTFGHLLEKENGEIMITHTVTIEGGEENQMKGMGRGITAGIPYCLQQLLSI